MLNMRCYNCGKVKKCKMVMTILDAGRAAPVMRLEYLCAPCRRELGYALPGGAESPDDPRDYEPGPDAAYDTLEERDLARDYAHGGDWWLASW